MTSEGLHQVVARRASSRPNAAALVHGDRVLTYAELDRSADAWAAELVAAGVASGDCVPVLLPRGVALVTSLLAVLKAGAAYALLDPAWPVARRRVVLAELGARILVMDAGTDGPPVSAAGTDGLRVWSPPAGPAAAPPGFRPVAVDGSTACCMFFTSGTTGRPKGVLVPHRATARLFPSESFARFDADTVIPLAAPVAWDAFSLELWAALLGGGTSVVVSEPYLSAGALREEVARHGVNTVWLTGSLFNMIVDEDPAAFRGVGQVMTGGERLSPAHVGRFLRHHPEAVLLNGYGPVESTVFATTHRVTPADCERPDGIPLGRPVPGTEVHVLDGDRVCAVGEPGEICVAGDGLALRYLGDPALTAERFQALRLGDRVRRVYRTGDLGWWGTDGLLHFDGRADRQVKIRGHRIEPLEVERQIEDLLSVRSCRVLARRDDTGAARELLAFCVPAEPGDPLADAHATLRDTLPAYLCPAAVVAVETFPTTPYGKLDERALLARAPADLAAAPVGGEPSGDATVRLVSDVFGVVLGRERVPADVAFTDLGGDSLAAGRVCARLAARLGRPIPVSLLYTYPTAGALAGRLRNDAGPAAPPTDSDAVPLNPMQLMYLTRHLLDPADLTSHCLLTWVVDGEPDRAALETAVEAVHLRHEALRAAYLVDPQPVARPADPPPPPLEVLPGQPSVDAAIGALRTLFAEPLLPGEADLWRTALVPAGPATVFGCVVHHVVFDGWSEAVLARDLADAYNAAVRPGPRAERPVPPPLLAVHRDHAERARHAAGHLEDLRTELAGVPALRWPAGATDPGAREPGLVELSLSPGVVASVDARAAKTGVSRFVVLLQHYAAALAEVTGQRDFAVGVPLAQRHGLGLEHSVGCHITMLALRMRGAALDGGDRGVVATGRAVHRAMAAQDVPFPDVLRLASAPAGNRPPLFQTLFALQDNAEPRLDLHGLATTFVRGPYLDLPLELHAELWARDDGGLLLTVGFRRGVVPETVVRDVAKRFTDRLHQRDFAPIP